jgi:hypothetical protein
MDGTPLNMTTLLVVALAVVAMIFILKKKYDSNVPLLFYAIAVVFSNASDHNVNPFLLYTGLAFALMLRFEFMNPGFAKVISFFTTSCLGLIIYVFLYEVMDPSGTAPF